MKSSNVKINKFHIHYQYFLCCCQTRFALRIIKGRPKAAEPHVILAPAQFIHCDMAAIHLLNALSWFPLCMQSWRWPWKETMWCILMIIYSHIQETVSLTWFSSCFCAVLHSLETFAAAVNVIAFKRSLPRIYRPVQILDARIFSWRFWHDLEWNSPPPFCDPNTGLIPQYIYPAAEHEPINKHIYKAHQSGLQNDAVSVFL